MPAAAAWVSVGELRDADGLCPRELRAMRIKEGFVVIALVGRAEEVIRKPSYVRVAEKHCVVNGPNASDDQCQQHEPPPYSTQGAVLTISRNTAEVHNVVKDFETNIGRLQWI